MVWSHDSPDFGGMSGIVVSGAGAQAVAISDRGFWATGRMIRNDGLLTAIETTGFGPLRAINGAALDGEDADAEGLAADPDGGFVVSFEAFHRIRRYPRIDGPALGLKGHPDFPDLQNNSALEALAIDGQGRIYAIPERSGGWTRPFPIYRLDGSRWDKELKIPRRERYLVVGADFGPDGRLYLLEREFRWIGGFSNRVRRFVVDGDAIGDEETLLQTSFGALDNMEGISVWRDADGRTRVTLISDDNYVALVPTVIAEYLLAGE